MPTLILHVMNEDPIQGEVDQLPATVDNMVLLKNPRRKDGKDLIYLDSNVTQVYWPISRINFIEVIPTGEDEEIISFVRE